MGEARPYWRHIGAIFVVSLLSVPLTLLTPVPLKIAVDSVLGSHPVPGFVDAVLPAWATRSDTAVLAMAAGMFVAVALLTQLQDLSNVLLKTFTGERLVLRFRSKLFQNVQRLSLAYHDRIGTADSTYRIQYDAMSLQYIAVESVISLITAVGTLGAMIYVTYRIDPQLALVALAVSPPILLVAKVFRPRMRSRSREVKQLESSALSVVQEVLTGLRVVKAFGQENREHERFVGRFGQSMRARIRLALVQGAYALLIGAMIGAGGATVLFVGVRHVQQGAITLGELLLVMGYLTQLYGPLKTMARKAGSLQNYLASAERAFEILDQAPEVPERPNARRLARASGAVRFSAVSFAYEPGHPVLSDVSFAVEPGERVGIAGPTGAGKSTLMNLLTRFYHPTSGRILLDGVDLRDYKLADLRNQFGIVLQEPVLFSTSIAENIAYARPAASEAQIEAAARAANAHDFITSLPEGYATPVGERGMRVSGGERQRISLARAFLKDAPILILDEPTSSVDVKTEAVIMEAMERLMSGRTSFMIAHRLSTLDVCERRLEIDRGSLVEALSEQAPVVGLPVLHGARRGGAPPRMGEQAAVSAWLKLRPGVEPRALTVLKGPKQRRKSAVYRLEGCGPGDTPVIAKRCKRGNAEIESMVYRYVLPSLPIRALHYHGTIEEDAEWSWIFVEEARGERYSLQLDEHRRVAARWLAAVHSAASHTRAAPCLPDRGANHYLEHLRSARKAISIHARDQTLASEEAIVLKALQEKFDALESRWSEVAAFCGTLPRTLVHGDFRRKHLRVQGDAGGAALVAFDWENAGYGVPAADFAQLQGSKRSFAAVSRSSKKFSGFSADPCLETYRSALQSSAINLNGQPVELLGTVGNLFRCLAGIDWMSSRLASGWTPLAELQVYAAWMSDAMQEFGLEVEHRAGPQRSADSVDEHALLRCLEEDAFPTIRGKRSAIARLERTRSANGNMDILTAHLTDGEQARLFLKDFGFSRAPKDDAEARRTREVHVYRDLLDGSDFGVPEYYGCIYDERKRRFWLLLELVAGTDLRSCGLDHWSAAARWLGRLHGYFALDTARFESSPFLIRHDRDFLTAKADNALVEVAHVSNRAARRLARILAGYDAVVDVMASQPLTFVHGNYRPKNILLDLSAEPVRVCPVDWEVAAIGATLYDLALLSDGYESTQLEMLFEAYRAEAIRHEVSVPPRRVTAYIVDCFCLSRVMKSLSRAREQGVSESQVSELLDHGEELHKRLRKRSRVSKR